MEETSTHERDPGKLSDKWYEHTPDSYLQPEEPEHPLPSILERLLGQAVLEEIVDVSPSSWLGFVCVVYCPSADHIPQECYVEAILSIVAVRQSRVRPVGVWLLEIVWPESGGPIECVVLLGQDGSLFACLIVVPYPDVSNHRLGDFLKQFIESLINKLVHLHRNFPLRYSGSEDPPGMRFD